MEMSYIISVSHNEQKTVVSYHADNDLTSIPNKS